MLFRSFFNLVTFCCAMTHAVADFLLGNPIAFLVVSGTNAILAIFWLTISHLHHTHIWMPFTGILGRIVTSPAHHQIHHSKLPHHLDKNLGGHLAIWDWAFGTLYVPSKQRETLDLGIERPQVDLEVFRAFADALATLRPRQPSAAPRTVPAVPEAGRQLEAA